MFVLGLFIAATYAVLWCGCKLASDADDVSDQ